MTKQLIPIEAHLAYTLEGIAQNSWSYFSLLDLQQITTKSANGQLMSQFTNMSHTSSFH